MKQPKYIDPKADYKKKIIVLFVVVFFLIMINILLGLLNRPAQEIEPTAYEEISDLKEIIEYYGSTYISEKESSTPNIMIDVYLKFKVLPYNEDRTSNEKYYTDLITDCARVTDYSNLMMYDTENSIKVEVRCGNGKVSKIIINDIEDYFIYMDSKYSLERYVEIPNVDLEVSSAILKEVIYQNWTPERINFGQRDSIFDYYYIYQNPGYRVRTINNKVYNIVFSRRYKDTIIGNTFVGMDVKDVKKSLGKPSFEDEDIGVIGYKTEDFYVFFTNSEVSVYRTYKGYTDDFFDLADEFVKNKLDLKDFMNQLTDLWPDYSSYEYGEDFLSLKYPQKGIEISINKDDKNGILVYNNIRSSLPKIERFLENTQFVAMLQIDAVFEAEKERIEEEKNYILRCEMFEDSLTEEAKDIIGESLKYRMYPIYDANNLILRMKFIGRTEEYPNRELNDYMTSYLWINSDYFLYSKSGKGLYFYDLTNGSVKRVMEGKDDYQLKGYKDGILKYDDTEVMFQY